jgi:hypothetical protein
MAPIVFNRHFFPASQFAGYLVAGLDGPVNLALIQLILKIPAYYIVDTGCNMHVFNMRII